MNNKLDFDNWVNEQLVLFNKLSKQQQNLLKAISYYGGYDIGETFKYVNTCLTYDRLAAASSNELYDLFVEYCEEDKDNWVLNHIDYNTQEEWDNMSKQHTLEMEYVGNMLKKSISNDMDFWFYEDLEEAK